MRRLVALAALTAMSGCMTTPSDNPAPPDSPAPSAATCPVIGNGDWQASLDAMPGLGYAGPSLVISGTVDLPTPGYTLRLIAGPADRAMPPSQRFRLEAVPPSGMVAQAVTSTRVSYREKATYPAYRSIVILCGDLALATISEIPTTR